MNNQAKISGGKPYSGQKFGQPLVSETPVFDGRRKHNRGVANHSGNMPKKPKWVK